MGGIFNLKKSTAVVTGASGFIGSHLVDYLVQQGFVVHALIRKTSDRKWLKESNQVKYHIVDLEQDQPLALSFLEKADYLFHCAGLTKAKTREIYFRGNAYACEALYGECAKVGHTLKAIVHLSSLAAAGPSNHGAAAQEKFSCSPVTYYGESKLRGEEIAMKYASFLPIVVIRPPMVYGPRESNFLVYLKAINKGWKIKIGTAHRELSLVYVADLVRAMVQAALCFPKGERIYYVTDGSNYTWDKVADSASRSLDVKVKTLVIPKALLSFAANVAEVLAWFSPKPALVDRQRVIDLSQTAWVASSELFFESHGFKPAYSLDEGLDETVEWCKEHKWL